MTRPGADGAQRAALLAILDAADNAAEFLVWWTSEADARKLGEEPDWSSHPNLPDYIRDEFSSRYGRAGRGRLWVPPGIQVSSVRWDDNRPTCRAAADCGGVVFRRLDIEAVAALPGFITDTAMNEMVGALLPADLIRQAREAISDSRRPDVQS